MCHSPMSLGQLEPFFTDLTMKCTPKIREMLSEQVLARWRRLVAFRKALDLVHQLMCAV